MAQWPGGIAAITLFTEDLDAASAFYQRVFDLPVYFSDAHSAVFRFGATLVNLLQVDQAPDLVAPAQVASAQQGVRMQLTLEVDDVDGACARLAELGVPLLNGPVDRPWGIRTASFRDPSGHVWEIGESAALPGVP